MSTTRDKQELHQRLVRMATEIEDAQTHDEAKDDWLHDNGLSDWLEYSGNETPQEVALDDPEKLVDLANSLDNISIDYRDVWEDSIEDPIEEAWRQHVIDEALTFTDGEDNACTWMDGALECYERGKRPLYSAEWQPQGEVVIVQTTGGPHIEIVVTESTARIDGFWGGDKSSVHVDRDKVLQCFPEISEFV